MRLTSFSHCFCGSLCSARGEPLHRWQRKARVEYSANTELVEKRERRGIRRQDGPWASGYAKGKRKLHCPGNERLLLFSCYLPFSSFYIATLPFVPPANDPNIVLIIRNRARNETFVTFHCATIINRRKERSDT